MDYLYHLFLLHQGLRLSRNIFRVRLSGDDRGHPLTPSGGGQYSPDGKLRQVLQNFKKTKFGDVVSQ